MTNLLLLLSNYFTYFIIILAIFEFIYYWSIGIKSRQLKVNILNALMTIVRDTPEIQEPEVKKKQHDLDKINAYLTRIELEIENTPALIKEIHRFAPRDLDKGTYPLEKDISVTAAIVQIFPLLGILGTVIALATGLGAENIIEQLGNAIWTTIWGISFAVIFMPVDAIFQTGINRLRDDFKRYSSIIKPKRDKGQER